jgi:hypothetical protein
MNFKLGKKLGVVEDPRTFKLKDIVSSDIIPPDKYHIDHNQTEFPLFANDQYGDCTCASQGHRIVAQERNASQKELALTDEDVLEVYSAVTGFRPDDPNTDNGAYCLDVLNYMRRVGMGQEKDGTSHTIYAYAKVNHKDHNEVKLASYIFGGVYTGVALPISAQSQVGDVWEIVPGSDSAYGSWGGHAMSTVGYDETGPIFITWGALQHATWDWWHKYVDESYAVISEDLIRSRGTTRLGFNLNQLQAELANLR